MEGVTVAIITCALTVLTSCISLGWWFGKRFGGIDTKLEVLNLQMNNVQAAIDARSSLGERVAALEIKAYGKPETTGRMEIV
jgi:hypothetical protein